MTLPPAKPPAPSAITLGDNAKSYAAAAELLMSGDHLHDPGLAPAFYLLVGFGFELLLKAIALEDGASEQDLKAIGHDLHKAYLRAMQSGKVPRFMTPLGRFVLDLNQQHKGLIFRYTPDVPQIEVPPPRDTLEVLNDGISTWLP